MLIEEPKEELVDNDRRFKTKRNKTKERIGTIESNKR